MTERHRVYLVSKAYIYILYTIVSKAYIYILYAALVDSRPGTRLSGHGHGGARAGGILFLTYMYLLSAKYRFTFAELSLLSGVTCK